MTKRLLLFLLLCASPAYSGQIVNDTFTRAVNADLVDHTSDSGHGWDENVDGAIRVLAANDYASGNASDSSAISQGNIATPDMVVEADMFVTNSSDAEAGLTARVAGAADSSSLYYCGLYDDTAGAGGSIDLVLGRTVASTPSNINNNNFNGTSGTTYRVRLKVVGSSVSCCVNHTTCITATNTEVATGNYSGIYTVGTALSGIDNYKAYSVSRGNITE